MVVEALEARSEQGRRELDDLAVVDAPGDGEAAFRAYLKLHRSAPERELYVLHTDREEPDITERTWLGLSARMADLVEKARRSSGLDERRALETAVSETRARRRES